MCHLKCTMQIAHFRAAKPITAVLSSSALLLMEHVLLGGGADVRRHPYIDALTLLTGEHLFKCMHSLLQGYMLQYIRDANSAF
jgi:hypothetical protein